MKLVIHHYTAGITDFYTTACGLQIKVFVPSPEQKTWHYSFDIARMAKEENHKYNKLGHVARACKTCLDRHSLLELAETEL